MTLHSSLGIASQALDAHAERLQVHASNVANVSTPGYIRKIPVLLENNDMSFENILGQMRKGVIHAGITNMVGGVEVAGLALDPTPGKRIYSPGHPQADKDGYITMSNVNIVSDVADALVSARIFEANIAVASTVKAMANRALEIGRGQ